MSPHSPQHRSTCNPSLPLSMCTCTPVCHPACFAHLHAHTASCALLCIHRRVQTTPGNTYVPTPSTNTPLCAPVCNPTPQHTHTFVPPCPRTHHVPSSITAASSGTRPADAPELISMDFLPPLSSCSCTHLHSYSDTGCFQHQLTCKTQKGKVGVMQIPKKPKAASPPRMAASGSQLQLQPLSEWKQESSVNCDL